MEPILDIKIRLNNLLDELSTVSTVTAEQNKRLFSIYNEIFPTAKEHAKNCPTCRSRVYQKLIQYNQLVKNSTIVKEVTPVQNKEENG